MKNNVLTNIKGLILDMDGVLWRDKQPVGDLPAIFSRISSLRLKCVLATNNSTMTREQYLDKLGQFGVRLEPWQIVTSSIAAALYLAQRFPDGGAVYIVGENGLEQALKEKNFTLSEEKALAVLVGMDRQLTYQKLKIAVQLIRGGSLFIATNTDRTFPISDGVAPGAGALVAAIETAADVKPVVVGKPSPTLYEIALANMGIKPEETLVVGDRLETDITGGKKLGCRTALVLSGVTSEDQVRNGPLRPDFVTADLASIVLSV
jgi:4-nitrophenyl phosphatase